MRSKGGFNESPFTSLVCLKHIIEIKSIKNESLTKIFILSLFPIGMLACDNDGIDILDIEIPDGYALSAGTATIF